MVYFLDSIWAIWLFAFCHLLASPAWPASTQHSALSRARAVYGSTTTLENQLAHKPFKISTENQNYSLNYYTLRLEFFLLFYIIFFLKKKEKKKLEKWSSGRLVVPLCKTPKPKFQV
jgi:uncharacterized membrane protein